MKFIASSHALRIMLAPLGRVVNPSTVLPILEDVLVQVDKDTRQAMFTTSCLETTMSVRVSVETNETFAFTTNYKRLMKIVSSVLDQPLSFDVDNKRKTLHITGDGWKIKEATEDEGNFPKTPEDKDMQYNAELPKDVLQLFKNALPFVSMDDLRPSMTGIYFHNYSDYKPTRLRVVATDAHSLYNDDIPVPDGLKNFKGILPRSVVNSLLAIKKADTIKMQADDFFVRFDIGSYVLHGRLIDARYPDYKVVLPTELGYTFHMLRKDLKSFIRLAEEFVNKSTNQIVLTVSKDNQKLEFKGGDLDFEYGIEATIPIYNSNKPIEVPFALNLRLLQKGIQFSKDEYVKIEHTGSATKAIMIDNRVLLMPLMINA